MSFHRRGEPPRAWKSMASPSLGSCGRACVLQAAQDSAVCTSLGPSWPLERPLRVCRAAPGPPGNQYDLWGGRLCSSGQPRRTGAGLSLLGVHLLISREAVRMKCGRTVCVTGLWPTWHERGLQVADSGDQPPEQRPGMAHDSTGGPLDGARSASTRHAEVPWASPYPSKPWGPRKLRQVSGGAPAPRRLWRIILRHKLLPHFTPG